MIVLRQMREDEYPAYCRYFIKDYGREIVENYGYTAAVAEEKAAAELEHSFPEGVATHSHSLLCIDAQINGALLLAGYLWHSVNIHDKTTFIYDFYVLPEYRGNGYGTQAIGALESQMFAMGVHDIKLRVAFHNQRALRLYQETGFRITGYNMSKKIGQEEYEP